MVNVVYYLRPITLENNAINLLPTQKVSIFVSLAPHGVWMCYEGLQIESATV